MNIWMLMSLSKRNFFKLNWIKVLLLLLGFCLNFLIHSSNVWLQNVFSTFLMKHYPRRALEWSTYWAVLRSESLDWTAKIGDPNYTPEVDFWIMIFYNSKNSHQDLSNEGSNFILSSLEVGHWVAKNFNFFTFFFARNH